MLTLFFQTAVVHRSFQCLLEEFILETANEIGKMWTGDIDNCFLGIKQVAAVLSLQNKLVLVEEKYRRHVCPNLNIVQLRQLLALYTPGEYGRRVPVAVINAIAAKHNEDDTITGRQHRPTFPCQSVAPFRNGRHAAPCYHPKYPWCG